MPDIVIADDKTGTVTVTKECPLCNKPNTITAPTEDYIQWLYGASIQVAFPYLSADDREGLMTGTHGPCFDAAFKDDDLDH